MAQENIAKVTPLYKYSIGARFAVVGEVEFPAKYKTEGCEFTLKQLEELGLPEGVIDFGVVITSGKAAKNVEQGLLQFNISGGGASKEEVQKVKIQAYESITTALNKEVAAEGELFKKGVFTVLVVGR